MKQRDQESIIRTRRAGRGQMFSNLHEDARSARIVGGWQSSPLFLIGIIVHPREIASIGTV
jgi:hypothetical protein